MALMGLSFGPSAADFLDNMAAGKVRAQIVKKAYSLLTNSCPAGCKKLNGVMCGTDAVWRLRSGDYRILYIVRPNEVLVLDIDHRKDVYR